MPPHLRKASGFDLTVGHAEESQPAGVTDEAEDSELAAASAAIAAAAVKVAGGEDGDDLGAKRAYKIKFQEGLALFNKKPKKGKCCHQFAVHTRRQTEHCSV